MPTASTVAACRESAWRAEVNTSRIIPHEGVVRAYRQACGDRGRRGGLIALALGEKNAAGAALNSFP